MRTSGRIRVIRVQDSTHTLSVLSLDADTTRRPSGNTATPTTYNEDRSQK